MARAMDLGNTPHSMSMLNDHWDFHWKQLARSLGKHSACHYEYRDCNVHEGWSEVAMAVQDLYQSRQLKKQKYLDLYT